MPWSHLKQQPVWVASFKALRSIGFTHYTIFNNTTYTQTYIQIDEKYLCLSVNCIHINMKHRRLRIVLDTSMRCTWIRNQLLIESGRGCLRGPHRGRVHFVSVGGGGRVFLPRIALVQNFSIVHTETGARYKPKRMQNRSKRAQTLQSESSGVWGMWSRCLAQKLANTDNQHERREKSLT